MDALLEFRKILVVGYTFDTPEGAPLLDGDGLPLAPVQHPIRFRVAFWIPQAPPFRRRDVGTYRALLASIVAARGPIVEATRLSDEKLTLLDYMAKYGLSDTTTLMESTPPGYTLVADATEDELEALCAGVIVEQIQDFTFPRQPSAEELRKHLLPHWERRTLDALGHLPNRPRLDNNPKPFLEFEGRKV